MRSDAGSVAWGSEWPRHWTCLFRGGLPLQSCADRPAGGWPGGTGLCRPPRPGGSLTTCPTQGHRRRAEGVEPPPGLRGPEASASAAALPTLLPLHVALGNVERKSHVEEGPSGKHPHRPYFTNSRQFPLLRK